MEACGQPLLQRVSRVFAWIMGGLTAAELLVWFLKPFVLLREAYAFLWEHVGMALYLSVGFGAAYVLFGAVYFAPMYAVVAFFRFGAQYVTDTEYQRTVKAVLYGGAALLAFGVAVWYGWEAFGRIREWGII